MTSSLQEINLGFILFFFIYWLVITTPSVELELTTLRVPCFTDGASQAPEI